MESTLGTANRRRSPREALNATTAFRVIGDEHLCRTCDLSEGGVGLVIRGVSARPGDPVEVDVVIGDVLKKFRGVVAFTGPSANGAVRVGVRFADYRQAGETPQALASQSLEREGWPEVVAQGPPMSGVTATRQDRRSARRRKCRLQVQIDPGRRPGLVEDISEVGAFVWSPTLHPPGNRLHLRISSSVHGIQQVECDVKRVLRQSADDVFSGRSGMGVAFVEPLQHLDGIVGTQGPAL